MVNINSIRHEKEKNYLLAMQIIGALLWLLILASTFGIIILIGLFVLLWLVIIESYFKAVIYGNSVKVNESQYPEIYKIIKEQSEELNLHDTPDVFIYNGNGIINDSSSSLFLFSIKSTKPDIRRTYFFERNFTAKAFMIPFPL